MAINTNFTWTTRICSIKGRRHWMPIAVISPWLWIICHVKYNNCVQKKKFMTGRSKLLAQRCERVWVTGTGNCPVWIVNFGKWQVGDQVKVVQFGRATFSLQQYGKYTESSLCLFTCLWPSPSELGSRRTRQPFNRDGQTSKQTTKREIQNQQTNKRDQRRISMPAVSWEHLRHWTTYLML